MEQRELWDKTSSTAEAKLKAKGVQFVDADKAAFYKATQPIRDKYGVEVRRAAQAHRRHEVAATAESRGPIDRRGTRVASEEALRDEAGLSAGDGVAVPGVHRRLGRRAGGRSR